MKFQFNWKMTVAALAAMAIATPALAGTAGKYQVTYVPDALGSAAGLSDIQMPADRAGKLKLKQNGSDKDGEGGFVFQIAGNAKLTCASNPDSKGLCGDKKGTASPAVSVLTWTVLGAVEITNVSRLSVVGGKITIDQCGKNKCNSGGNVAASTIFGQAISTGYATLNDPGTDDSACDAGPTVDKSGTCYAATPFAVAGFMFGTDLSLACSTDADCTAEGTPTLVCNQTTNYCEIQTCTENADCNTGQCNTETGNCCDPSQPEGGAGACPAASPSGAFLEGPLLY